MSEIEPTVEHFRIAREAMRDDNAGTVAQAIADAEARGAGRMIGHNRPPGDLMPEKLIDPDALPALFEANYPALIKRSEELAAGIARWKALHLVPKPDDWPEGKAWPARYQITGDDMNNRLSDFLRQIASFAGGKSAASGEVDEARSRVKKPILDSAKVTDAWFNNLRDDIRSDVVIMDRAQTDYLRDKQRKEQDRRDADAAAAIEEANRKAEQARAAGGTDAAVEEAVVAEAKADAAVRAAEAPVTDQTRTRSAAGTTTSLVEKWTWKLVDIAELAKAVVAGKAPSMFLTTNDSVIGAAVRPKNGLRECPGLVIEVESSARRSGRTS